MNKESNPSKTNFYRSLKFQKLESLLSKSKISVDINGLHGSSLSLLIIDLFYKTNKSIMFLCDDESEAKYIHSDIVDHTQNKECLYFPSSYNKLKSHSINKDNALQREKVCESIESDNNRIYVSSANGIAEKVSKQNSNNENTIEIKCEEEYYFSEINEKLFKIDYQKCDFVQSPGDFALRGRILDVFTFSNENPIRIQFDDNNIESIREFDVNTQFSIKELKEIKIKPSPTSSITVKDDCLLNLFNNEILIITKSLSTIKDMIADCHKFDNSIYIELNEFNNIITNKNYLINVCETHSDTDIKFNKIPQPSFNKNFDLLNKNLLKYFSDGFKINIYFDSVEQSLRFDQIIEKFENKYEYKKIIKPLYKGFIDKDEKKLRYTDHEIFNRFHSFKLQKRFSKSKRVKINEINKLNIGDYVTHIDHGIGIFKGLSKIDVNGKNQEVIRLDYGERDTLYLSVHLFHKISKFNGKDGAKPRIYKLGSGAWDKLKSKAKSKVKKLAFDLIKAYAKRKLSNGYVYKPDSSLQLELEASFLYVETEDQLKASNDVKNDMHSPHPMDRLICGDVGFGKTEIAIRAAFKAVDNGKQVVILVPTTILAFQHYKTLSKRFKDFPVSFDYLNRFKSTKERNKIIDDLKNGRLDIIVGTHQVMNDKITYKNLGLLIVDEEQKFGVNVKEKIRSLKENIDVLTLTATPIPRTLQYSLMSARDLSIINTPPPNRVPISSEVIRFENSIISDAIQYELQRGGQIFFVHNRVNNIEEFGNWLRDLVPNASIKIGHGKMEGKKLEKIMLEFINNEFDILLSTTIIESGLDVPNANTIFINNAHNFGLSDLHQMRGRVGRSNKNAFCYFITPPTSSLTNDAKKRINTISQYTDLGSGFNISMRDLEIRGAGDILGGEQSGFMNDIGFETYHKILNEAVEELKQKEFKSLFKNELKSLTSNKIETIIDTDFEILFPTNYIQSSSERLTLYKKLSELKNEDELEIFREQLYDRFGSPPKETEDLIESVKLKWIGSVLNFRKITLKNNKMLCYFPDQSENKFFNSKEFISILQLINNIDGCKMKEKNIANKKSLYVVFENINTISEALENLNRLQLIDN